MFHWINILYLVYILIIPNCHYLMSVYFHCRALRAFVHICIKSFQGPWPGPLNKTIYTIICAFVSIHLHGPRAWAIAMLGVVIPWQYVITVVFDRSIEFKICYMILQLYTVYPHLCAKLNFQVMFLIIFYLLQQVYLILLCQLPSYIEMIHLLKCCMLQFCDIAVILFYICLYIFLIPSNSYFLLNDVFIYICCSIFSSW